MNCTRQFLREWLIVFRKAFAREGHSWVRNWRSVSLLAAPQRTLAVFGRLDTVRSALMR